MWNRIMMEIGLRIKTYRGEPPTKPFNDYLIPRLFNKLINQLGLSDVSTGELRNQSLTTVKSRDGEPLAAVGIATSFTHHPKKPRWFHNTSTSTA